MKSNIQIFCDFDGTVAQNDVGNQVFTSFGDEANWWRLVQEWKDGKIDGRSLWREQCKVTKITQHELESFAVKQPLDPYFADFAELCGRHKIPITILSDGMDAYIKPILKHHGYADLSVRANHLKILDDASLQVEFPYYGLGCKVCANCKGYHLRSMSANGDFKVYVGDGISDRCAAKNADITFAKGDLLSFCEQSDINYYPFQTFSDVLIQVEKLRA